MVSFIDLVLVVAFFCCFVFFSCFAYFILLLSFFQLLLISFFFSLSFFSHYLQTFDEISQQREKKLKTQV